MSVAAEFRLRERTSRRAEDWLDLVRAIALHQFRRAWVREMCEPDDLISAGTLGLLQAIRNDDGVEGFSTFAAHYIKGAIREEIARLSGRGGDHRRKRYRKMLRARSTTAEELAEELEIPLYQARRWLAERHEMSALSLDMPAGVPGARTALLQDFVAGDGWHEIERAVERCEVRDALQRLPEKHAQLLVDLYWKERTGVEIAEEWGVTSGAVYATRNLALTYLSRALEGRPVLVDRQGRARDV